MSTTNIEWTDRVWNPVRGCSKVSPGCTNCYAERTAAREPLSWRKPQRVFVNSMSDLFHEKLTNEEIAAVFAAMALSPTITFQVLTKRAARMREWFAWAAEQDAGAGEKHGTNALWNAVTYLHRPSCALLRDDGSGVWCDCDIEDVDGPPIPKVWPLPNVWLGVSVENQAAADERIPHLLDTPAAVRFLSVEPLLAAVDLTPWVGSWCPSCRLRLAGGVGHRSERCGTCHAPTSTIDWVIVGGESGPGARPCDVSWIRGVVEQCKSAGVPVFVKQLGAVVLDRNDRGFIDDRADTWPEDTTFGESLEGMEYQGAPCRVHLADRKGGDPDEWPEDLRVREFPEVSR